MKDTMTGNRVLLKLKGDVIGGGICQNVNVNDDLGLQDVDGLGDPETLEFVTGKVSHTISLSRYFVYNKKLDDLGFVPKSEEYLSSGELEIEIIDKVSLQTVELYVGCKAASHSRSYGKHQISGEDVSFRARHKGA